MSVLKLILIAPNPDSLPAILPTRAILKTHLPKTAIEPNFFDLLIIRLSLPLAVLGALSVQWMRGLYNDIYCQVGLLMLVGLASKNSILMVEFANQLRSQGLPLTKAIIEASQDRLRPILMTAIVALLGAYPMLFPTGAGAASRLSLGTTVFGGTFATTFLSLFVVPVLYIVIGRIQE